ncbi:MAG: hypothetical protein VB073_03235 [Proteiniphilum sp.]|nr:hypothetical protein [Proteiniphilum sp.]
MLTLKVCFNTENPATNKRFGVRRTKVDFGSFSTRTGIRFG